MSIRAVFRVQCDGPCKGWLSFTEDYVPGTDIEPHHEVVAPTARLACNWPEVHPAARAAQAAGWTYDETWHWQCPNCMADQKEGKR